MSGDEFSARHGRDAPLASEERSELEWLRTENALLRTERDILVRLATGFAEDAGLLRHGPTATDHTRIDQKRKHR